VKVRDSRGRASDPVATKPKDVAANLSRAASKADRIWYSGPNNVGPPRVAGTSAVSYL
jgi:hypothetical protein